MQKKPRVENRRLLDLAHEMPCFATMPHRCTAHLGCHPAHANWQRWGKGVGKKVSDWAFASVCGEAHKILDGKLGHDTLPQDEREYFWLEAFISTQDHIWAERLVRVA